MKTIYTTQRGPIELRFSVVGQLLATVDDRLVAGRQNPRWQELTLYRLERGGYLLQMEELTTRDEPEFMSLVVCPSPQDVLEALRDNDDEGFLADPGLAYELLKEAAQVHVSFREIWDEIETFRRWLSEE